MTKIKNIQDVSFGTPIGISMGNVTAYSSDYDTVDPLIYKSRSHFRSYVDDIYMGHKWQCVEFARRWLYTNKGYIFNDVAMAYEIFNLRSVRDIVNNSELALNAFENGAKRLPEVGSLLIWDEGGEFEETGHVAIITAVFNDKVHIAEQNMAFAPWPNGQNYSREIKAKLGSNGDYWLHCPSDGSTILGWLIQTDDETDALISSLPEPAVFNIEACNAPAQNKANTPWLNLANDDEYAFFQMMAGHRLSCDDASALRYYRISPQAHLALETATDELHQMFMHATDYVLEHPELLEKFGLPKNLNEKIKRSWSNRANQLVTSRFDFSMSEHGLKVYEYNCDSASCYMEVGKVQGKWLKHFQVKGGTDAGTALFSHLVKAWQARAIDSVIHILQDDDPEETYHALFMKNAIEAAGHQCKILVGIDSLTCNKNNEIEDSAGIKIQWIWKTWAWETALDEIRANQDDVINKAQHNKSSKPSLSDVLLNDNIMVFEPLWTLIPSNKAILPVLCMLFPNHPYLLNTSFELTDELKQTGYVSKPIVGRCGANIKIIDENKQVIAEKPGNFETRDQIYQTLFPLPYVENKYVQVCTFTANGNYAGSGVRVDSSMIIDKDSDCLALQCKHDV
ncbi:glutathionylspermidine synthase [Colwellia sp. PAMC 20917]|uniref:glutathionylspermidine synthase family protein n=1 Tax=Colwellia sp. PAMC 20917 TaxID=1816218 RepID=UPI00087864FD|nr:glutathionylspermidine synthase family protein [Colwellia sp. PAMC 20917]AOW76062.1 glutathionylspermidine synthase [Colwellia sp. PAMC 20917]